MRYRWQGRGVRLLTPDTGQPTGGAPSGGGSTADQGATPPPAAPAATGATPPLPADPTAAFNRLLDRHERDGVQLARQLYDENYRYREQIRALQGQLPAAGAVVLPPEQATAWATYQQLGAPDALRTALAERQQFAADVQTLRQETTLRDVAAIQGYDLDVLRTVGGALSYVIKDETKDGKPARVVYVKDGETETPLSQVATQQWVKFLPALAPQGGSVRHGTPAPRGATPAGQGAGRTEPPAPERAARRKPLATF